jgi:hypothetical protein
MIVLDRILTQILLTDLLLMKVHSSLKLNYLFIIIFSLLL